MSMHSDEARGPQVKTTVRPAQISMFHNCNER
jgi:hypothetical protein